MQARRSGTARSTYAFEVTWQRRLAWAAALLTAAAVLGTAWLAVVTPSPGHALVLTAAIVLGGVPSTAGLAVSARRERSLLGALVVLPGLLATLALFLALVPPPPGEAYFTAASQGAWVLIYVVVAVPLLMFPDGRPSTRGARWLLAWILLDAATFMVTAATAPGPFLPPNEDSPHVLGTMPGALATALSVVTLPGLWITLVLLVVHLVRRYRVADESRRRQFRWLSLGAGLLPLTLLGTWLSYALIGNAEVVLGIGLTLTYLALPTLIAVAICRPDLFDVDRALVASVVSSVLAAGLLTIFTVADVLLGIVLSRGAPAAAVAVTAGVAVLLAPVARRVRRRVDSRLYPARHAAFTAVDDLQRETLEAGGSPEELQARLREALQDPGLVVAYRTRGDGTVVDATGTPLEVRDGSTDVVLGGRSIGLLEVGVPVSPELVRAIAARAAPLVELVRLRLELRRALLDAEESRARLLRVGYEERVRLERDLHDGAQQRLVALGMALRLAQRRMARGADVAGVLDEAVAELGTAVSELRQLAHGIRPSCLDDGLVPALSHLVSSTPLPITLRVTTGELDTDVETTAYYVAAEAITNAVKHAGARHIALDVDVVDGQLHVRVSDDGSGRAAVRAGSGLAGLVDRVGAHGGHLSVDSRSGVGTVVEAVLPCAS